MAALQRDSGVRDMNVGGGIRSECQSVRYVCDDTASDIPVRLVSVYNSACIMLVHMYHAGTYVSCWYICRLHDIVHHGR